MKQTVAFILNFPWNVLAVIASLLCLPRRIVVQWHPLAFIITVQSFWWLAWLPGRGGVRATTLGNVVILGPHLLPNDLEHELIHVDQYQRTPLIHPFLYQYQSLRYGYRNNKYEIEAYKKAGNQYINRYIER